MTSPARPYRIAWAVLGGLLLLGIIAAVAGGSGEAQGSSVSRGAAGWLAARRYLEARGAQVTLWREPLDRFTGSGVLVLTFPWQHGLMAENVDAVEAHMRRGGDVILAWSGTSGNAGEILLLEGLGLTPEEVREAPLNPAGWRTFIHEEWDLRPAARASNNTAPPVRIWAPRFMPELPRHPEVVYQTPEGRPAVVRLPRLRGALWLLPADALANARLGTAGNADLLELLLARLGPRWTFDEYHHGLITAEAEGGEGFGWSIDLMLLHLALLYGLAVLALARRFGPPWREPPVVTGSVSTFLLGLGSLHHRLGHHGEAARRLVERSRELAPDLPIPDDLDRRAATAGPRDLVPVARALAALRRGSPSHPSGDRP